MKPGEITLTQVAGAIPVEMHIFERSDVHGAPGSNGVSGEEGVATLCGVKFKKGISWRQRISEVPAFRTPLLCKKCLTLQAKQERAIYSEKEDNFSVVYPSGRRLKAFSPTDEQ